VLAGAGLSAAAASAQGYLGFGVGKSDYDRGNVVPDLITAGSVDGDATGFKLYGGYRFHPNFALEMAYVDLGKAGYSGNFLGAPVSGGSLETWGFNFSLVGIVPLNPGFEVFGKVGAFAWEARARDTTAGFPFSATVTDWDISFGLGLAYNVTSHLSLRAEWERFRAVDDIDLLTLGLAYRF
jgi:OOP family OmpA-OmpF porin